MGLTVPDSISSRDDMPGHADVPVPSMVHQTGPCGCDDAPRPGASQGWRHKYAPSPLGGHVVLVVDVLIAAVQDHAAALRIIHTFCF